MLYAMAILKSKTPISSSHGQHKEARPSHIINSLRILHLFYFLFSYYPLIRKRSSLLCAYKLRSQYGACIVSVPYCATRAQFLKRRVHTDKNSRAQEAYDIKKNKKNILTTRYVANRMRENDSVACDATRQIHF